MEIIVFQGKYGLSVFLTAVGAVRHQIEEMYQHLGDPGLMSRAQAVVDSGVEARALCFLRERAGGEYERFFIETLGD